MDPRIEAMARLLVRYSMAVKAGDRVLIEATGAQTFPLVEAVVREAYAAGGVPFYLLHDPLLRREWLKGLTPEQARLEGELQAERMRQMDCYCGVRGGENALEAGNLPEGAMRALGEEIGGPVHGNIRIPKTRWVVMRWPSGAFAQAAMMPTRDFEDLYFRACLADYAAMSKAMDPLVELMERTDRVRIVGPGTDLSFSIRGMPAIKCDGRMNVPDGEVFTAPVRDSVNGTVRHNTPTLYDGNLFDGIELEFRNGRIVRADCRTGSRDRLNGILDRDESARCIGEFALGVNREIRTPMMDILFDEKIAGSFHFTPGSCYDECDNGNRSSIHWDMVSRQTDDCGGGEIWFDGQTVRKDGLFVLPSLAGLNP